MKSILNLTCCSTMTLSLLFGLACEDEPTPVQDVVISPIGGQSMGGASANEDTTPPPHLDEPRALVYLHDPVTDNEQLSEVTLPKTRFADGSFTSEAVEVYNCLNEPGGAGGQVMVGPNFNIDVALCREEQTVRPDPDGHYLSIEPPPLKTDPNDAFAEVMMYYHVNQIYDYYLDRFGYTRYNEPLTALVNVQFTTDPPIPGFPRNPDGFIPFDNAAFFPKETWEAFAAQFGLPPRNQDSIIFFQGQADFSYDASVIYHEYTHAVIGINRLQATVLDEYGADASPSGMNEGLADYFAATFLDQEKVGPYGIGTIDFSGGRDLSAPYRCPTETHWEVHVHGRVIASALWAVREEIGAEKADLIAFRALEQFIQTTTHQEAAELLLAEAASEGVESQVRPILVDYGIIDCVRSRPWVDYSAQFSPDRVPYAVGSVQTLGNPALRQVGAPAYKQFYIDLPDNKRAARISWTLASGQGGFGGFGGGQGPQALELAVSSGSPVQYTFNPLRLNADFTFGTALEENTQTLILDESCFPEKQRLHTLFLNKANSDQNIERMNIEFLDEVPTTGVSRCVDACADGACMGGVDGGMDVSGMDVSGMDGGDIAGMNVNPNEAGSNDTDNAGELAGNNVAGTDIDPNENGGDEAGVSAGGDAEGGAQAGGAGQ